MFKEELQGAWGYDTARLFVASYLDTGRLGALRASPRREGQVGNGRGGGRAAALAGRSPGIFGRIPVGCLWLAHL